MKDSNNKPIVSCFYFIYMLCHKIRLCHPEILVELALHLSQLEKIPIYCQIDVGCRIWALPNVKPLWIISCFFAVAILCERKLNCVWWFCHFLCLAMWLIVLYFSSSSSFGFRDLVDVHDDVGCMIFSSRLLCCAPILNSPRKMRLQSPLKWTFMFPQSGRFRTTSYDLVRFRMNSYGFVPPRTVSYYLVRFRMTSYVSYKFRKASYGFVWLRTTSYSFVWPRITSYSFSAVFQKIVKYKNRVWINIKDIILFAYCFECFVV